MYKDVEITDSLYNYIYKEVKDKSLEKTDHIIAYANWFSKVPKQIRLAWEDCVQKLAITQGGYQQFECLLWNEPLIEELFQLITQAKKLKETPHMKQNNVINEKMMDQFIQAYNEIKPHSINEYDWFHQCTVFLLRRYGEFLLYKKYITKLREGTMEKLAKQEYSCAKRFTVMEFKGTLFNVSVDINQDDPIFLNFPYFQLIENNEYITNVEIKIDEFSNLLVLSASANFLENAIRPELKKDFYSSFLYNISVCQNKLKDEEKLTILEQFKEGFLKSLSDGIIFNQIQNILKLAYRNTQQ